MAEVLPSGDKIRDYDSRVDPNAPADVAEAQAAKRQKSHSILGHFSLVQIHVITLVLVLASSGLVPFLDLAFALCTTAYIIFLNTSVFKPITKAPPPDVLGKMGLVQRWTLFTALVGLLLPTGYVLGGFVHGDQSALKAATPHLFLLGCQILTENITFRHDGVSLPVRALVPIFYNVRRLFTLVDWVKVDMSKGQESVGMHGAQTGPFSPEQWIMFGRILAASNLLIWTLNLFFFLIPVYLPRAFRKHYEMEFSATESRAKDAPDASQS
ncbi:hypothetical protein KC19_4G109600 [Ceratodon purpureus]|uniref:DUF7733 domain-containing protein n=1 Tax=Ceratodon purpureus TaxID=3225 RepID=A0A8T0IAV2_CERPU|nr:hypothetical protein KC19_4G109600 [Ceratodon purpureus]